MRILVIGASGLVGSQLVRYLVEAGHQVLAAARHTEAFQDMPQVERVEYNMAENQIDSQPWGSIDAVYFTAGSRGKNLLQVDAFGAVKAMKLATQLQAKRFILLSSIFATEPEKWSDPNLVNITDYNIAKFFADHWLIHNTDLNYTIIQPGNLIDHPTTDGLIQIGVPKSIPNSIDNVARTLVAVLEEPKAFRKIIQMGDGHMPIKEALQSL